MDSYRTWTRSLGGPTSNRYSTLNQINRSTVGKLRVAWTYRSGDGPGNVQCNPIIVGDVLFAPTAGKKIVALDAATGMELWRFTPLSGSALQDIPARRGLTYWPGDADAPARILFAGGTWIYALDPKTGVPIRSFGDNGRTPIPTAGTAGGVVWKHIFVIPGYLGDVFGYDVATGRQLWRFHTIAQPGEFGAETWEDRESGANCWGGMALDESRGIAFISTGSPKPNFVGARHRGDNLFADCVIALKADTGERLWHFQEVRHDIWDFDLPAPPNLVTVMRGGRRVDAVAQVTKIGNTLLLDRVTGKPLFPFRLRRAPASTVPGEEAAPYQPDVQLPEPFIQHVFTFFREDITTRTPAAHEFVANLVAQANIGIWFAPFEPGRASIYYGDNGGANWPGASFV
ncbi:MAG: PQQ-binding-like beta-propeller repeat protein, partial [Verrucomicrobia bacterium]|nr:PQQ-binding-like beta-propeller repeat protein [Verrucomicrobiota bacterium]